MRKSFVATLLAVGAIATLATGAFAQEDVFADGVVKARRLSDVQRAAKLRGQADGDTTYVGYNPAFAGANNPWQVGVGAYRPYPGSNNARRGFWDWDTPIAGDSLQGFWPIRHLYSSGTSMPPDDKLRPWYALEHGNVVNYVINQGAPKRTFGIVGVWHADPGGITSTQAGTNPSAPNIVKNGTRAAWCGLRGHGDRTAIDGITGNPISAEAIPVTMEVGVGTSAGGTGRLLPGYIGAWDQMLYRDLDVSGRGNNPLLVRFKLRTRMSTNFITGATTRVGWCQFDPTNAISPNFISSTDAGVNAPRDSFMVYVGKPVEPVGGANNDYVNASGQSRDIYDPLRRWFSEIVRIDGTSTTGRFSQIYGAAGNVNDGNAIPNDGFATINCGIGDAELDGIGNTARLVFRSKTNRAALANAGNSDDETGSYTGTYNSGYGGAAIVDDVEISINGGGVYTTVGNFEAASGAGNNIDNSVAATVSWRSTGKPPAIYPHVRDINDVGYTDLCGDPGNENRTCNMDGTVMSMGEYPNENKAGTPATVDFERWDSIMSPTIILATAGPATPNSQGITGDMANASEDYYLLYDWNTAAANGSIESCFIQEGYETYPAAQEDGSVCWSDFQRAPVIGSFDDDICATFISDGAYAQNLIYTTNASGIPDSLRFLMRKLSYCFRFSATNCGDPTKAWALDNMTFAMIDGASASPLFTNFWQWLQDAFPANENPSLPGTAAFDTAAAWPQIGLNTSVRTTTPLRHNIAGDTSTVQVSGANVRTDVVFRILPGPGNYVTIGTPASGLRRVPTSGTAITSTDSSFWTSYILNNGTYGTAGGHPAGAHASRWSNLVWNSARCDTADFVTAPVEARGWGQTAVGGGFYSSMLHEDEYTGGGPRAKLAIFRNQCYLQDTTGVLQAPNINCGRAVEGFGAYPPAWVNILPQSYTGYPTSNLTAEGTKIFPDGVFTPGTHIQYFFRRQNLDTPLVFDMMPDTNQVLQVGAGNDTDGKRWQTWSVLPDAWKKNVYGGLGSACMLYVDWNDGRGNERVWVSIADSIGATSAAKFGAHNGWHASGSQVADADVDDPAGFVRNKNAQPGTTWDMYGVKAGEAGADGSGSIGSRESNREPSGGLEFGKDARNAPTQTMLDQYGMLLITTSTLQNDILGPFSNRSQDDKKVLKNYLLNGTALDIRGLFILGDGFLQSIDPGAGLESEVQTLLAADLVDPSYREVASDPLVGCPDLTPTAPITSNGDVYGFNNSCQVTLDVLGAASGGTAVVLYPDNLGAGVLHAVNGANQEYWISLTAGLKLNDIRSRFCGSSFGRLRFMWDALTMFENVIGISCALTGDASVTLDTPQNGNGQTFVDFMSLKNNPLVKGNAVVSFGLSKSDRVTLKVYDVTGRLVRTLLDNQSFQAGNWDITWDGADNIGRQVPRGVYFSSFETAAGRSFQRKMTVLK
jgi:hypothetical protein